jgi:hypothetical protein
MNPTPMPAINVADPKDFPKSPFLGSKYAGRTKCFRKDDIDQAGTICLNDEEENFLQWNVK